jgi:hypothetical protein
MEKSGLAAVFRHGRGLTPTRGNTWGCSYPVEAPKVELTRAYGRAHSVVIALDYGDRLQTGV